MAKLLHPHLQLLAVVAMLLLLFKAAKASNLLQAKLSFLAALPLALLLKPLQLQKLLPLLLQRAAAMHLQLQLLTLTPTSSRSGSNHRVRPNSEDLETSPIPNGISEVFSCAGG
ncbi:hypothetical protein [Novipirellula caenicola]|uniref:hypothetical protein n=1 Tax=Novipirellula caenicola TaxID=1536901 RepID=UPI0031E8A2FF